MIQVISLVVPMRNPVVCSLAVLAGLGSFALGCGGSDLTLPSDSRPTALGVVGGDNQAAAPGNPVPQPLVVRATDSEQRPVDQVRVAFVVTSGGGSTTPDTAVTDADGRASTRWTLGPTQGAQAVEARVVGADVRATFLGIASTGPGGPGGPALTTTDITSASPSPSFPTQPIAVAVSVSSSAGTPTGTVTVSDGTVSCNAVAPTGQCTLTPTTAGTKTLTAAYGGSSGFAPSSGSTQHDVVLAPTSTSLSSSKNPSNEGDKVTFTVRVSSVFGSPTGSVQLIEGSCSAPTQTWGSATLDGGQATIQTSALTEGTHDLIACYAGSSVFAASASNVLQQDVTKKGRQ